MHLKVLVGSFAYLSFGDCLASELKATFKHFSIELLAALWDYRHFAALPCSLDEGLVVNTTSTTANLLAYSGALHRHVAVQHKQRDKEVLPLPSTL